MNKFEKNDFLASVPPTAMPTLKPAKAGTWPLFGVVLALVSVLTLAGLVPGHAQAQTISTVAGAQTVGDGGPATSASLRAPVAVVFDPAGNMYIADCGNNMIRKVATNGILTTIAGNGQRGNGGDGGPATSATLTCPLGIALDSAGSVFFSSAERVRKIASDGKISTVAGNGNPGFSGDGGPAVSASLCHSYGLAFDASDNLYIGDRCNHRVRRVTPGGTISTVAGNGIAGFSGDGGAATAASLNDPTGIALDAAGNIYIADANNQRIRKLDSATGFVSTLAGNGVNGMGEDNVLPTASAMTTPYGVQVDNEGTLYFSDYSHRIRFIGADGLVHTKVGNGLSGFTGDGGPATSASISYPESMTFNVDNEMFLADADNYRIRMVSSSGIISTVVGIGKFHIDDGDQAMEVLLGTPQRMAVDGSGNFYFSDTLLHLVLKVTPAGVISAVAGNTEPGYGGDGGPATSARLNSPYGIAHDATGNLYIADRFNHRVRKVEPDGTISTFAGIGTRGSGGDGNLATAAQFNSPEDVAVDADGNVYIADRGNNRIRKVTPNGLINTVAGTSAGFSGDGGSAEAAQLRNPTAIAFNAGGNLFISDRLNHRIRRVDAVTGIITTFAGNGTAGFGGDGGLAIDASLSYPAGVHFDSVGNLYVADQFNRRIRKIASDGTISTVAGNGLYGFGGDGLLATASSLSNVMGVAIDAGGNLLIADPGNARVRKVSNALSISDVAVAEGDSGSSLATFTVSLSQVSTLPVTFDIGTAPGTAGAGSDYVTATATGLTIAAGQTSATFDVTINGDTTLEVNETFSIDISGVNGAAVADGSALGTITNDDHLPNMTIADVSVAEGDAGSKLATFKVNLSKAQLIDVTVDVATSDVTATAGSDYAALTVVGLTIPAGLTSATFTVIIAGDTMAEANETFLVSLANAAGATITDGQAAGTISNDDLPGMSIGDASIIEGDSGSQKLAFTVSLSAPATTTASVTVTTADGLATAGSDYVALSSVPLAIPSGLTSKTFTVTVSGDLTNEGDESFLVTLGSPVGATISDDQATGIIVDNDNTVPTLSIADVSFLEGNRNTKKVSFRVSLSKALATNVTVDVATSDGTATAGSDYVALNLAGLLITAGQTSKTFTVTIKGDTAFEADEIFQVNLANPVGATIGLGQALGAILNDDAAVTIAAVQGESGSSSFVGETVAVTGVVTARTTEGFFLQSVQDDGNQATSEGVFVATDAKSAQTVAVGQLLKIKARVAEVTTRHVDQRSQTELVSPSWTVLAERQPAPAPVALIRLAGRDSYERYEGMRVMVPSLTVVAPVEGKIDEVNARARANGVFYGVPSGMARPFREPGLPVSEVAGQLRTAQQEIFDQNPERLRIESNGQRGSQLLTVDTGATITGLQGVLADADDVYRLLPDPDRPAKISAGMAPRAVPRVPAGMTTIGSVSLGGLFDDLDDPRHGEPVLTSAAYAKRLAKSANALCRWTGSPTIVGVDDAENLPVLSDLATAVNDQVGNILFPNSCQGNPAYRAYLVEGNDVRGGNVGLLVSATEVRPGVSQVQVLSVTQLGKTEQFTNLDGSREALNERPPLLLNARVNAADGSSAPLTVLVVRLRPQPGIDNTQPGTHGWKSAGDHAQAKRSEQAAYLARVVKRRRDERPEEPLVVLGDFNARAFNDGHAALIGTVAGEQETQRPMLVNLTGRMPQGERYTVTREGNAEALSHVLVSEAVRSQWPALHLEAARINADFGVDNFGDMTVPVRTAERDPQVLYLQGR